jgi:hypothetical protein
LSAGFGGLPWVCCCGVAGDGFAGFCGSLAEIVTLVMVIFFHERTKNKLWYSIKLGLEMVFIKGETSIYFKNTLSIVVLSRG